MPADVLMAAEAARLAGVRTLRVIEATHFRRINYVMVDGIAHYRPEDVERWVAEGCPNEQAEP